MNAINIPRDIAYHPDGKQSICSLTSFGKYPELLFQESKR